MKIRKIVKLTGMMLSLPLLALYVGSCDADPDPDLYTLHFIPGTYNANGTGYNQSIPINIAVTFSETAITVVTVLSHQETAGVSDSTIIRIPELIVERQTLAIDAVSGATARWTKEGILKAVENCVFQAGGDEAVNKLKE